MNGQSRPRLTVALWLGALPVGGILLLVSIGAMKPIAGFVALLCTALWSAVAGLVLARDLHAFKQAVESASLNQLSLITPGLTPLAMKVIRAITLERGRLGLVASKAAANQALLDRLPDPLFRLDLTHGTRRIVWRNPAAQHKFGDEAASLLRHPALRAALDEADTAEGPIQTSVSLAAPMPRDLDAIVIRTGVSPPASTFLLLSDRTHERSLDRMRADFVANASHELRTPLTSLIGFIETLRGPAAGDTEANAHFLAIMAEQAERMQRIIADLLSLSRIEMMEHHLPKERVEPKNLLRDVATFMAPLISNAEVNLDLDIPDSLPPVHGDAGQLTQIFANLIDNAIKYGRRNGTVKVRAVATPEPNFPQAGVLIDVIDDGPGIAHEHIPRLTERFYRVDKGRSRLVDGTGLGLAIVKHAVSRHRGRFVIESTEGIGTTCRVWLPLALDSEVASGTHKSQVDDHK